ncbi:MAG TPA: hypothetical protein VEY07_08830 [Thermoplasmata archaeon]|nr:hypothetical protein [Thermoplasmata archaeon]
MALIDASSAVSDSVLRQMYSEHLEGIQELAALLDSPSRPVTDPARIALARSFADHVRRALSALDTQDDRPSLVARVNLSYEAMLILIDYSKTYTEGSRVPRNRSAGA